MASIRTLFEQLTRHQLKEVQELYQRHFSEDEEPDFEPVLADFTQKLAREASVELDEQRLEITAFSEYENEAKLLAYFQEKAAADPEAAEIRETPFYIDEFGEEVAGPELPSLNELIAQMEAEMANDEWEQTYYPDFSLLNRDFPPNQADFETEEAYQRALAEFEMGYGIDFMPTDLLVDLPIVISQENRERLSTPLIIADFLYENYFFGGENVDEMKNELLTELKQQQMELSDVMAKKANANHIDRELKKFLDEH